MKSLLIAASVAAMTIGGAAYAGSGSSGSSENPQANPMPGSSATSGGSMPYPTGNPPGAYQSGPATGPAHGPAYSSPPQGDGYGSSGTPPQGGPGAVPHEPRPYKRGG